MKSFTAKPLDRWAIALSAGCLMHCVIPPILVATGLLTGLANSADQPWLHLLLLLFIAPVSVIALYSGRRRHRRSVPLFTGIGAIALLVLAETLLHELETALVVSASLTLIWAHASNLHQLHRQSQK